MTTSRRTHHYVESGLHNVYLHNVEFRHCPTCGEDAIVIPTVERLHEQIAQRLIARTSRLAPEEVRFLRKHMGYSTIDFAAQMDVRRETVSRWETGALFMSPMAERLLRLLVAQRTRFVDYPLERLTASVLDAGASAPAHLVIRQSGNGWSTEGL